jgi:hypothetical protein
VKLVLCIAEAELCQLQSSNWSKPTISITCWRTISSIIPVVSGPASAVSPETYIICFNHVSAFALSNILKQFAPSARARSRFIVDCHLSAFSRVECLLNLLYTLARGDDSKHNGRIAKHQDWIDVASLTCWISVLYFAILSVILLNRENGSLLKRQIIVNDSLEGYLN